MRFPTYAEYDLRNRAQGLGISLDDILGVGGPVAMKALKDLYDKEVVGRVSPFVRRQGESFGQSIVDGTGEAWAPKNDPNQAVVYQDFVRPLVDPFAKGVKARLEPHVVKMAAAQIGPIAIVGGLVVGFLVGRASK